jgi:predicted permease
MLSLLGGAVGFLLLIACANVANVVLAYGLRRERETAVRAALGAGRLRLVRLFLCESLAISLLGGLVGLLAAAWSIRAFRALPAGLLPRASDVAVDARVLAFAIALSGLTTIVFGLAPALQLSHVSLMDRLRQAGSLSARGTRLRRTLITIEVALSLSLLVAAGLMLRTLGRLSAVDPGYRPQGLLAVSTQQPGSAYAEETARRAFATRVIDELRTAPGVSGAALAWPLDQVGISWSPYANFPDKPFPAGREPAVQMATVTPTYFETMGIPMRRGRALDERDREGTSPIAVVNETVVRRFLPPGDPIGRHVMIVGVPELRDLEIVGVVGDTLRGDLAGHTTAEVYCAYTQFPAASPALVVRAAQGDPLQLVRTVEARIASVDSSVATYGPTRLADAIANTVGDRRMLSKLLTVFAALALGLTGLGIAGVVSFVVAQRTQEIGLRIALGARPSRVVRMVIAGVLSPVLVGLGIGGLAIAPLTRLIETFLFQVAPSDPLAIGGAAVILIAAAVIAAYVPARRATTIDPLTALRAQ